MTFSTRLNSEQRGLLEKAAAACDMTPAKFLRDAALRRARDVLQSQPPNDEAIRMLAGLIRKRLHEVSGEVRLQNRLEEHDYITREITSSDGNISIASLNSFDYPEDLYDESLSLRIHMLTHEDRQELLAVLEASPLAFAEALLAEYRRPSTKRPRFQPVALKTEGGDDEAD